MKLGFLDATEELPPPSVSLVIVLIFWAVLVDCRRRARRYISGKGVDERALAIKTIENRLLLSLDCKIAARDCLESNPAHPATGVFRSWPGIRLRPLLSRYSLHLRGFVPVLHRIAAPVNIRSDLKKSSTSTGYLVGACHVWKAAVARYLVLPSWNMAEVLEQVQLFSELSVGPDRQFRARLGAEEMGNSGE